MKQRNNTTSKRWQAAAYGVAFLLLMMAGCDNATSPNQDLTSSYDTPGTMQSGDAMNTTIDEQPIYTVPGFYFLAPMVKDSEYSGTFDAGLSPVVEICETTACATIHESFDMDGEGSERVRLDEEDEHYIVNWHTDQTGTEVGQTYRIRVSVAGTVLAHADIQMAENGRDAKNITDDEAIALVDGRTLPIKFRVEEGAVYVTDSGGGTIISEDGLVTLEIPENAIDGEIGITISSAMDELDDEDVIPGTLFDFGPSPFTFNEPVILTIIFDPANLPAGVSEDELRLLAVVDGEWVQLPGSSVDVLNSTVTGPIDSFSRKGVGRGKVNNVAVTPADASLEIGGTQQFEATLTNVDGEEMNRNVRWSSSDEDIATIDSDGLATALTHGDAIIEARAGNVTGTANLSVEVSGPVADRIEVSPATATINTGATQQFVATVYDQDDEVMEDETVTWSSGDDVIASVDEDGLATGISEGETTIIASVGEVSGSANLVVIAANVSSAFVTKWDTNLASGTRITLGLDGTVDATISWGDGTTTEARGSGPYYHTYNEDGIYTVSVTGTVTAYNSWDNTDGSDRRKLIEVVAWGNVGFKSLHSAFRDASNLLAVPASTEGIENVSDMSNMFWGATSFNGDISDWNTGNVTNMANMFREATAFNGDIGSWDTRNVMSMFQMFFRANAFNGDIGSWDTGNVKDMSGMFSSAHSFNQNIGIWNTGNVTRMQGMFRGALAFNQDIGGWDTRNVTTMNNMFTNTNFFNQDIGRWDTGNVTDMSGMFSLAYSFNQDISDWNTGNVTNMSAMFTNANSFNQDIGDWDTRNVEDMSGMFGSANSFNQNIGGWDTGKVTDMRFMFQNTPVFNGDIGNWNTVNVRRMTAMFRNATAFNGNIDGWDTGNVNRMNDMFNGASSFNRDLSGWCVSLITSKPSGFDTGAISWILPRPLWGTCPE